MCAKVNTDVYHIEALRMPDKDFEVVENSLKAWQDNVDVLRGSINIAKPALGNFE